MRRKQDTEQDRTMTSAENITERYGILDRTIKKLSEIRGDLLQYGQGVYDQPMLSAMPEMAKLYLREAILEMLSAQNKLSWALELLGKTRQDGPPIKALLETI